MFESQLADTLKPLVAGRVFPDVGLNSPLKPYITWQQVGGSSPEFEEDAVPAQRHARVQINVWSDTRQETNALALAVESALVGNAAQFTARPVGAFVASYESDTELYGTRQDFSIWSLR